MTPRHGPSAHERRPAGNGTALRVLDATNVLANVPRPRWDVCPCGHVRDGECLRHADLGALYRARTAVQRHAEGRAA
jgi:hypothetical protein